MQILVTVEVSLALSYPPSAHKAVFVTVTQDANDDMSNITSAENNAVLAATHTAVATNPNVMPVATRIVKVVM